MLRIAAAMALSLFAGSIAYADMTVRVGVLTDLTGPYASLSGEGSITAAKLAAEEFEASNPGVKVDVIFGDHQNKADIGSAIVRKWYDQGDVDAVVDITNSAVAFAVNQITRERNKVFLASGPASPDLYGKACAPTTVLWTYDTYAMSQGTGRALAKSGGSKWFFITADYAFGHALERDTTRVVESEGGKVVGQVRAPLNTADFSPFLLQAQSSGANVLGLANAGLDMINAVKQASEFGIARSGMKLAGLLVMITDVRSLGLNAAQGLVVTEPFYWDLNPATRGWSQKFAERARGKMPSSAQAGAYSATLHYLKAVAALGSKTDGAEVVRKMKAMPTSDPAFGNGMIRKDGRKLHDMFVFEVKTPGESKSEWDLYKLVATIAPEQAFKPMGDCVALQ